MAVDDGDFSSSSSTTSSCSPYPSQANTTSYVQLRLTRLHLAPTSIPFDSPPESLTLLDHSGALTTASQYHALCRALARDGSACRTDTNNKRGLCWRHRPGSCFHSFFDSLRGDKLHGIRYAGDSVQHTV